MNRQVMVLMGPNNHERDSYELVLRRRGMNVHVWDDTEAGFEQVEARDVHAVLVMGMRNEAALDALLLWARERCAGAPVFLKGSWPEERWLVLRNQPGVVMLPATLTPEMLDHILFPPSSSETELAATKSRFRARTVVLGRTVYSCEFRQAKVEFETEFISRILARERGNISRAARVMNIARRNLQVKIRAYGIDVARYRGDEGDIFLNGE